MMRSLFSAIAGLRNHTTYMDVVGNNLANVNTTGYKASRLTFSDLLSQTIAAGSAPQAGLGGVNGKQVGLGSQVGSIDILEAQGSLQSTGKDTDLAISGSGFFILKDGSSAQHFTRDGAFDLDATGRLVSPGTGLKVQGFNATNGVISLTGGLQDLVIPLGESTVAGQTASANFAGNLNARSQVGDVAQASLTVVDSQGAAHLVTVTFTNASANNWTITATTTDPSLVAGASATNPQTLTLNSTSLVFDSNGVLTTPAPTGNPPTQTLTLNVGPTTDTAATFGTVTNNVSSNTVSLDFTKLSQLAELSEVSMTQQDGFQAGTLSSFRVSPSGGITGIYTNGHTRLLGQLALANFQNPGGLSRISQNMFDESPSSGPALTGVPGAGGLGVTSSGNLEASNVDLSREFTNMIIGHRGFEANARVISTADSMLEVLVNLRH